MIIRGGENIPVAYVENALYENPKIAAVAVVGIPDPRLQERACACVVLKPGVEEFTFDRDAAVPRREGRGQAVLAGAAGGAARAALHGQRQDPEVPAPRRDHRCVMTDRLSNQAFLVAGVRTPFGRYGGALAAVRPDDLAAHVLRELSRPAAVGGLGRAGRRAARLRQPGRRGQPQRRPDGHPAGRPAGLGAGRHGEPAVRVQPGRDRHGRPGGPLRRRRPGPGRRGGEHEPRPVRHPQGDVGVLQGHRDPRHHHRLAVRQPGDAPSSSAPTRCRRPRRTWPREFGIARADQDAFALRSQERTAKAIASGRLAREIAPVSVPQRRGEPVVVDTDEHPAGDLARGAGQAPADQPGRHRHRRERVRRQRRRRRSADRLRRRRAAVRADPAGQGHLGRGGRRAAPDHGHRTGAGHPEAAGPQRVDR